MPGSADYVCVLGGTPTLSEEKTDEGNRGRTVDGGDQEGAVSGMISPNWILNSP